MTPPSGILISEAQGSPGCVSAASTTEAALPNEVGVLLEGCVGKPPRVERALLSKDGREGGWG